MKASRRWRRCCGRSATGATSRSSASSPTADSSTNDRKARFVAPEIPALRTETSAGRPLRLNTGRIRDQWHTMTRTGLSPRLGAHLPEPFVEVHPDDAIRFGVADGGFARVTTDYGQCMLKVVVSPRQQRGMLFAPIHWSEATASAHGSARWSRPSPIPIPASRKARRRRRRLRLTNMCSAASCCRVTSLQLPPSLWWARAAVAGGYGYLFADNADLARWPSWLRSVAGDDLAEYRDFGGGVYRAASFAGDRIETCLFVGPARDAGDWDVVKKLFAMDALSDDQRRMLLSGKLERGPGERGPDRLRLLRRRPHHDLRRDRGRARARAAEIGARLKAGTNCGSCIPELKRLIAQANVEGPEPGRIARTAN